MVMPQNPRTQAEETIREEIRREGRVTFARFMDLALYSPGGYYPAVRAQPGGRLKDFVTSPATHPAFGWLLALQLNEVWEHMERPDPFWVVELGAGDGLLCRDILTCANQLGLPCLPSLRYAVTDTTQPVGQLESGFKQAWRVVTDGIPLQGFTGCILSNELLDALPVHRFAIRDGQPLEAYVALSGETFVETLDEPSSRSLAKRLESIAYGQPDGFRGEVCLELDPWLGDVARSLGRGIVLTIDYGETSEQLYSAGKGMLRCYYRHTVSGNPYVRVGRQDITSHVDFGRLLAMGEQLGLGTLGYTTQREFLRNLGAEVLLEKLGSAKANATNRVALQELLKNRGLGDFKVLAQGKQFAGNLLGLSVDNSSARGVHALLQKSAPPLLTPQHLAPPVENSAERSVELPEDALQHLWPEDGGAKT